MTEKNTAIFNMLSDYFTARHFQRIPTDMETVAMFGTLQKSSLYLVNLISLKRGQGYNHHLYEQYRDTTKEQFAHVPSDKVILLNVIITDEPDSVYSQIDFTPDLDQDFIDVHWLIDAGKDALIIPRKQLKSVLGLEKPIQVLLESGEHEYYELTKNHNHAFISFSIITINIVVWMILEYYGGSTNVETLLKFGAIQAQLMQVDGSYWRLLSAIFLHIGFSHLAYNTFSLYVFGSRLEKYLNIQQFLFIYLFSGIIGSVFSFTGHLFFDTYTIAAGASGAIYGLLGAILVLSKASGQSLEGLNAHFMILIFMIGMIYSVISPNVDTLAHIGGFFGGIVGTAPIVILGKRRF